MKLLSIIILALAVGLGTPALAAQQAADKAAAAEKTGESAEQSKANPDKKKAESGKEDEKAEAAETGKELPPGEYECKFYRVKLPDDWRAVMPPAEQQGNINAIFAADSNSSVVTMVVGPNGGADARTIADMFAEQFKAPKSPVAKNGSFTFDFPGQDGPATAFVSTQEKQFMMVTIQGKVNAGLNFIRKSITSEDWSALLPK